MDTGMQCDSYEMISRTQALLQAWTPSRWVVTAIRWKASLRRIYKIIEYFPDGHTHEYTTDEYFHGFREVYSPKEELPFPANTQTTLASAF